MYDFQPKALTDRELIKYGRLWLDDEPLPESYQRELLLRLEERCDELEHAIEKIKSK
jgi:hypothetical protein